MTFLGLGLAVGLLVVGGFSVDLWRVLAARRSLAEAADAAAAAGANGVDVARLRGDGSVHLEPALAVALAGESLAAQAGLDLPARVTALAADPERVVVGLEGDVELTLLRLFTLDGPITIAVTAEAAPVRGP